MFREHLIPSILRNKPKKKKKYVYFKLSEEAIKLGIMDLEKRSHGKSGFYLRASIPEAVTIHPKKRQVINTGIFIEQPEYYEAHIYSLTGFALTKGVIVLGDPIIVDNDYKGEIKVVLYNTSTKPVVIVTKEIIATLDIKECTNIPVKRKKVE